MVRRESRSRATQERASRNPFGGAQRGYLMVSLMIVLFVVTALLALYVERQTERSRLERGEQVGYALGVIGAGFSTYLDKNHTNLAANQPRVSGIANPLQPTAEELIRDVDIRGVASVPPVIPGASYKFQVSYPPGCTQDEKLYESRCRPAGVAYIDKALVRGGKPDYVALAHAARVMRSRGGYSRPDTPSMFTFRGNDSVSALISVANPTHVAGVLAWRAETLPEDEERLKTNGSNQMKATLRLDGDGVDHDLIGARHIEASGNLSSEALHVRQGAIVGGDLVVEGGLDVRGRSVMGDRDQLVVEENALIKETASVARLSLTRRVSVDQGCNERDEIAMSEEGYLLICSRDGIWKLSTPGLEVQTLWKDARHWDVEYDLGKWMICSIGYRGNGRGGANTVNFSKKEKNWTLTVGANTGGASVNCIGRLPM